MSFGGHAFDMFRRNKANLEQLQQHRKAMAARRYRMKCRKEDDDENDTYNNDDVIYIETVLRKKQYKDQLKRKKYSILIIVGMIIFLAVTVALLFILPMPRMG